jgi:hypothetical protein
LRFLDGLSDFRSFSQHLRKRMLGDTKMNFISFISIVIIIVCIAFAPTPISREPPKRTHALRLLSLRHHRVVRVRLRARPRAAPASAEERKAHIGTVVREYARAELRVVRRADDVYRRAAHELHLLFVWLSYTL